MYEKQCRKCGRHVLLIKVFKKDKNNKPWLILTCPQCDDESDVEEYKEWYEK